MIVPLSPRASIVARVISKRRRRNQPAVGLESQRHPLWPHLSRPQESISTRFPPVRPSASRKYRTTFGSSALLIVIWDSSIWRRAYPNRWKSVRPKRVTYVAGTLCHAGVWAGHKRTYETAGSAKMRGSRARHRMLWVGLWVACRLRAVYQ